MENKREEDKLVENKDLIESDVKAKATPKTAFEYYIEDPTGYLTKLIKKNSHSEGLIALEEIIMQIESIGKTKIESFDKDELEILSILVLIFFLFNQKHYPKFEAMLNKLEDKLKHLIEYDKIDKLPFAFEFISWIKFFLILFNIYYNKNLLKVIKIKIFNSQRLWLCHNGLLVNTREAFSPRVKTKPVKFCRVKLNLLIDENYHLDETQSVRSMVLIILNSCHISLK